MSQMRIRVEIIPISSRLCDLCGDPVTAEDHSVTKTFVLTDWGVICVQCWEYRFRHPEEFRIFKIYAKSTKVEDEWVRIPLVFSSDAPEEEPTRS